MFFDSFEPEVSAAEADIESAARKKPIPMRRTVFSLIMMCPPRSIAAATCRGAASLKLLLGEYSTNRPLTCQCPNLGCRHLHLPAASYGRGHCTRPASLQRRA